MTVETGITHDEAVQKLAENPDVLIMARRYGFRVIENFAYALQALQGSETVVPYYEKRGTAHLEALRPFATTEIIVALLALDLESGRINEASSAIFEGALPTSTKAEMAATATQPDDEVQIVSRRRQKAASLPQKENIARVAYGEGASLSLEGLEISGLALVEDRTRNTQTIVYDFAVPAQFAGKDKLKVVSRFASTRRGEYKADNSNEQRVHLVGADTTTLHESVSVYFTERPFDLIITFMAPGVETLERVINSSQIPVQEARVDEAA